MPTIEEILALLLTKFQGARKDGLEQLAGAIAIQCESKEEAQTLIDKLSDEKVKGFITDWRKKADAEIGKATKTHEQGLRDKYNFMEKNQPGGQGGGDGAGKGDQNPGGGTPITMEAISKLIEEKMTGALATVNAQQAAKDYRNTFEGELDKAGVKGRQREMMLRSFDRANTFKTADEFNTYLQEAKGDIEAIQQEQANAGLGGVGKPIFGAVNKDGVSNAVADYLASAGKENPLSGKEV